VADTLQQRPKISIIVPLYNEQATIAEVLRRILAVDFSPLDREIVVVDDGSTDAGSDIVKEIAEYASDDVIFVKSVINVGKGGAVRFGFAHATGDIYIVQDADLELDPQDIMKVIQPILDGKSNVVFGSRFLERGTRRSPRLTRLANILLTWMTNILFFGRLTDMGTAYKAFRKQELADITLHCVKFDFDPEITAKFLKAGKKILEVPIRYNARSAKEGKKITWVDGIQAVYTLIMCRLSRRW
jgi:glycosyltransferase involved in cell wall biosynthesis